jgi:hypothetical protein
VSRTETFEHLAHEVHYASFLFVGFSLSDPNFNLIRDDARLAMGGSMPASYLAQERPDPLVRGSGNAAVLTLSSPRRRPEGSINGSISTARWRSCKARRTKKRRFAAL